jgi:hypothetical protein
MRELNKLSICKKNSGWPDSQAQMFCAYIILLGGAHGKVM